MKAIPEKGADREVLEAALGWLRAGRRVGLVTVVRTWGSSPRPAGSLMALRDDGEYAGSVSGGCVEADLVGRWRGGDVAEPPTLIDYGVDSARAARFGLPCGGRLELLVEELPGPEPLARLLARLDAGELVCRRVCLGTGEVSLHPGTPARELEASEAAVLKTFGPAWDMLIVGAGQLAGYVARMALMLDYKVSVCDPREEMADWELAGVTRVPLMPDDAVRRIARNPRSVILTLAHDPKLDDMALMEAFDTRAFYIGALGSRRTSDVRRRRLLQLGVSGEQLTRLHAPVGLPIGGRTPPEIALSVLAGVTAERHRLLGAVSEVRVAGAV
jgi:xanthine dehydrogenase accessory factor